MASKTRRVAVIGAGPSGAITTDTLVKEQAFDNIRVFDRRAGVGGTWHYTPHLPTGIPSLQDLVEGKADEPIPIPTQLPAVTSVTEQINSHQHRFSDTAIHENLHSNITPVIMSFSQHPFPDKLSERSIAEYGNTNVPFRHHTTIREWIESIFAPHQKLLELETTVERAEKLRGEWFLTLRKELAGRNYWWQETFDAVIVASGHYNVPWCPNIPGLLEFDKNYPGKIVHSKHFRNPAKYAGKKIIVVGASVSSHEIIHEVLEVAQHPVYAAIRGDPIAAFGWEPFDHPHMKVTKQIRQFEPETGRIVFDDGSFLDDVDHVFFGTGYTFSVPFIPAVQERIKKAYRRLPGVYQHTWNIEDPSLAFIGQLGGGFTFRVYEWQAVAVARRLAGRGKALPTVVEQLEWERRRVVEKKGGKDYYSIAPDYAEFFEFLRGIAGEPAAGTIGRSLPKFDPEWLKVWSDMVATKIGGWQRKRKRKRVEEAEAGVVKAKL
ncbi:Putative flavin monooxygenase, FAD/NAD(P)-binding domain superfamily [Septoria linicola]|uniref:Flavin monooxygenase, FAD/NAD(P)-binding domain superfamily n=1 Tax=Septoria linicola TaxID=215465 RepID=A0A9Q9AVU1_9PEZI|nr:Putative flavin monooxygenase, FAD/NAD(P)-binding domain superfamily [Septoria linicola]